MKLLIIGGKGMAGHMLVKYFKQRKNYVVAYTSRNQKDRDGYFLDVRDYSRLVDLFETFQPNIIINAVGLLNQQASQNKMTTIQVNSLLPHLLANLAEKSGGKFIHISTDCVFSGKRGDYKEMDLLDGISDYAKSKALGEVISSNHLTIRTSIIGPELKNDGIGLFRWFMKQQGEIKGYKNVLWNGVTTLELAKAIEQMIEQNITGLYQLGSVNKISKYDLLTLIQEVFEKRDVQIIPDTEIILDRTIQNTRADFQYSLPNYREMLMELRDWMETRK
ncbi:NAD(P)-dependent oxidoreductase [Anaerobacillus alkalidiazotrophicus]|uniref:dTDP-4-dehydrorhamnose reductase n=1 Tax=Anaerobacillus alkalidiazotrophicus TaxID=472963 RepID=A0A1S2M4J1_9BACI|nr:SDR family oxidoreductase [Anaerobacillus alkalidiazotrophicus]OIJ18545.1 NAD(P)-dependent oxidoreductase [Anaerobacillus alkalidiazotrophicus]